MSEAMSLPTAVDVAAIREAAGLTQAEFAAMLGISRRTLENWEALRREPEGPARVLLAVAKYQPKAIVQALRSAAASVLSLEGG